MDRTTPNFEETREGKQAILNALCDCLRMTRDQYDLENLFYGDDDTVTIDWENSGGIKVNVAMDSGIAMIRDVLRALR